MGFTSKLLQPLGWALLLAALPVTVQAQSKLDEVLARGHLIVGTGSTNAPWHFKGEGDVLQGFDIDIAKIVAKGLFDDAEKVEFVLQASDARIPNVVTDKVDITCQFMTVTAARAQQIAVTIPYYREGVGLTGSINRARLSAAGGGAKDITWRIQGEFRTGSVGTGLRPWKCAR